MPTAKLLHPDVPEPATWLGLAGVLPFAAGALAAWRPEPVGAFAATALLAYGAVISPSSAVSTGGWHSSARTRALPSSAWVCCRRLRVGRRCSSGAGPASRC